MVKFLFLLAFMSAPLEAQVFEPELINGRPALQGEFPEAVYLSFGGSRCTGSVVGERVILTAAHCGVEGSIARFQVGQSTYSARCSQHPAYPRTDVDLMLCKTDRPVDVKPATLGGPVQRGEEITIVGYGCVRPGGGGGNDGTLRVGDARVTGFSGHDIVSRGAGLCFGDSGGPAYVKLVDAFGEKHVQVSVNSKGDIRSTNYTAKVYGSVAQDWMNRWAQRNRVDVCGVNADCDVEPDPDPGCKE